MDRRLAAIMAADVAGFSRLMEANEEGTYATLHDAQKMVIEPAIAQTRGRIVKLTGDGFLAEFASVVDAVRAATAIQRAMAARNQPVPPDSRLEFRIGVNLGDVIVAEGDIYGDGVNVAARLEQMAPPGGILISLAVRDQIRDKLDCRLQDLGERRVKNVSRPVHVFRIVPEDETALPPPPGWRQRLLAAGLAIGAAALVMILLTVFPWVRQDDAGRVPATTVATAPTSPPAVAAPKLSIVVLPFDNVSDDTDQAYFAEGITEDLITDLSRISGAFVISRNTSFTYQGKSSDPKQVATELGVRYVLTGTVRRQADQVRIGAQLVDGETGAQVWADRFDRALKDLFSLQNEVTGRIARSLQLELKEAVSAKAMRGPPRDLDAQDYALRAWAEIWNRPQSRATNDAGLALVEKALALDPGNAEALATGSYAHTRAAQYGWSDSRDASLKRAIEMGEKAVQLDQRNADAYYVLSFALGFAGDLPRAHALIESCLALNPNHAPAYGFFGWRRMLMGYPEDVATWIPRAFALSPRDPLRAIWYQFSAQAFVLTGQFAEAEAAARQSIAANPQYPVPYMVLAAALFHRGQLIEAQAALARHNELRPGWRVRLVAEPFSPAAGEAFRRQLEDRYLSPLRRLGLPD